LSSSAIDALGRAFRGARLPAVASAEIVEVDVLREAREALDRVALTRFDVADRGAYDASDAPAPAHVESALAAIASSIAGRALAVSDRRWYRFCAGDYTLVKDDRWSATAPGWIDLSLDLSLEPTGEGEVVFAHRGEVFFTVPQTLGAVGVAERGATVSRFDRYLTHRVGDRVVERLRLRLDPI
jgi:hypothetical protein